MPRKTIDYSNTIIYMLCCKDIEISDCYVGHTTNFIKRKAQHKYNCNSESRKEHNIYAYQFIRENGGWDNWSMIVIEQLSCLNILEAAKRERYWCEVKQATLNKRIPSRTSKEYYHKNNETEKIKRKVYRDQHKDDAKEYQKLYYIQNNEKLKRNMKAYREKQKPQLALSSVLPISGGDSGDAIIH